MGSHHVIVLQRLAIQKALAIGEAGWGLRRDLEREGSMRAEHQLLHGPALAAVLKLLDRGPQSGFELAAQLRSACPQALALGEASLYALLYYLEAHRLATASWQQANGTRRRTYSLTERGRHRLADESRHWQSLATLFGSGDQHVSSAASREGPS
jgi:DNA-binding PadR family transcriptional regulator